MSRMLVKMAITAMAVSLFVSNSTFSQIPSPGKEACAARNHPGPKARIRSRRSRYYPMDDQQTLGPAFLYCITCLMPYNMRGGGPAPNQVHARLHKVIQAVTDCRAPMARRVGADQVAQTL